MNNNDLLFRYGPCTQASPADGLGERARTSRAGTGSDRGRNDETRGGGFFGVDAQVFQHEVDHLDGILWFDHWTEEECGKESFLEVREPQSDIFFFDEFNTVRDEAYMRRKEAAQIRKWQAQLHKRAREQDREERAARKAAQQREQGAQRITE